MVSTTRSARHKNEANIDFSSQHGVSATWKLSEKMDPEGVNSSYIHNMLANAAHLRPESCFGVAGKGTFSMYRSTSLLRHVLSFFLGHERRKYHDAQDNSICHF